MFYIKDGEYTMDAGAKTITFSCKKCKRILVLKIADEKMGWKRCDCNHRFCSARYKVDVILPQELLGEKN